MHPDTRQQLLEKIRKMHDLGAQPDGLPSLDWIGLKVAYNKKIYEMVHASKPNRPGEADFYREMPISPFQLSPATNKKLKNLRAKMRNLDRELHNMRSRKQWENALEGVLRCAKWSKELLQEGCNETDISRQLYDIIQHSLQTGPCAGAHPGKFKRGQEDISKVASGYLGNLLALGHLGFTQNQTSRMETWYKKAEKRANSKKN